MPDAINNQAARALLDINVRIANLVCWVKAAPYMMADEDAAVDVGAEILKRLNATHESAFKYMAELAEAAGVPSPQVVAALEASLDGSGFEKTDYRQSKVGGK